MKFIFGKINHNFFVNSSTTNVKSTLFKNMEVTLCNNGYNKEFSAVNFLYIQLCMMLPNFNKKRSCYNFLLQHFNRCCIQAYQSITQLKLDIPLAYIRRYGKIILHQRIMECFIWLVWKVNSWDGSYGSDGSIFDENGAHVYTLVFDAG